MRLKSQSTVRDTRLTICKPAHREVLERLLKLNHKYYDEEVKQGLPVGKGAAKKAASKTANEGATHFDLGEDD